MTPSLWALAFFGAVCLAAEVQVSRVPELSNDGMLALVAEDGA